MKQAECEDDNNNRNNNNNNFLLIIKIKIIIIIVIIIIKIIIITKKRSPPAGAERHALPTEVLKCNHWATGGLLELGSKFNETYMHIKCSFYRQPHLALENVV